MLKQYFFWSVLVKIKHSDYWKKNYIPPKIISKHHLKVDFFLCMVMFVGVFRERKCGIQPLLSKKIHCDSELKFMWLPWLFTLVRVHYVWIVLLLFSLESQELNDIAKRQHKSKNKPPKTTDIENFSEIGFPQSASLCLVLFGTSQRNEEHRLLTPLDARNYFFSKSFWFAHHWLFRC